MTNQRDDATIAPKRNPVLSVQNVTWTPQPRRVRCMYRNSPAYYTVYWGDSYRSAGKPTEWAYHIYDQPGMYYVTIVLDDTGTPAVGAWVRVRDTLFPQVSLVPGDDPRYTDLMYLSIDEPEGDPYESYYDVDWGDGKTAENLLLKPGKTNVWHGYMKKGDYPVKITDKAMRVTTEFMHTVTDPDFNPDFSLTPDPDDPMTVTMEVTRSDDLTQELWMEWDDGNPPFQITNQIGHQETKTYPDGNGWIISVFYNNGEQLNYSSKWYELPQTSVEEQGSP